jgi:hypothetical protein
MTRAIELRRPFDSTAEADGLSGATAGSKP